MSIQLTSFGEMGGMIGSMEEHTKELRDMDLSEGFNKFLSTLEELYSEFKQNEEFKRSEETTDIVYLIGFAARLEQAVFDIMEAGIKDMDAGIKDGKRAYDKTVEIYHCIDETDEYEKQTGYKAPS